jgi:hypothetical protein
MVECIKVALILRWSLQISLLGTLPQRGYYGEEFDSNSQRSKFAGMMIGGDQALRQFRWAYMGCKADAKARKDAHQFAQNYQCTLVCECCCAQQSHKTANPLLSYKNFGPDAVHRMSTITHETYLRFRVG